MNAKNRVLTHVVWMLLLLLLTACDSYSFLYQSQQPDTGTITVYTALTQEQVDAYLALFNTEYPNIKVDVFRESTGVVTKKLLDEANDPQADAIWGLSVTSVMIAEWKRLLYAYSPKGLERVQSEYRDHANPPHWVGMSGWKSVFCINHEKIKRLNLPVPKSAAELIDPIYSGQIVIPNPATSGTALLLISTVFEYQDEITGWQYLDQLNKNIAQYTHSGRGPCELVAEGQYPIGISYDVIAAKLKNQGKPIDIIFPSEGLGWGLDVNALINKKNINPAAKTFLDWAISDNAMNEYAKELAITSVPTKQALPAGYPTGPRPPLIQVSFPWITANRERILEEWQRRYGADLAPK